MATGASNPIEFQILLALAGRERHGYGIMKEIDRQSGGRVRVGPGTLYGAIKRMLGAKWIVETEATTTEDEEPDARRTSYYRLTAAGRRAAEETARQMADLLTVAAGHGLVNLKPS